MKKKLAREACKPKSQRNNSVVNELLKGDSQ